MAPTAPLPAVDPDGHGQDDRRGPSGWHGDPWRRHALRFFDGRLWTEHVADGGVASIDSAPVAAAERSRPLPERAAPPDDPVGARVLPGAGTALPGDPVLLGVEPLLLVGAAEAAGVRVLLTPDDRPAGQVVPGPPRILARLGRILVTDPSTRVTRLRVLDLDGREVARLARPWLRTAPVVDVAGPDGRLGEVVADRVVQGLRARVVAADGTEVGTLTETASATAALAVTDGADRVRARLTPVWDVPGRRHHLPPGVRLLDRRPPPGEAADEATAVLLLGALLAPTLLRPPR